MAFVRRKKMHSKHYYQLVRNDRVAGKHRQKVLCHLGVHDSIGAAIADTQRQVAHYEKGAASKEEEARRKEAELKERYGDDVEILNAHQVRLKRYWLLRLNNPRYMIPHYTSYYSDPPEWDRMEEVWEMDMEELGLSIDYHDAMRDAEWYRVLTTRTRDRLDKLLECQRKYFQQPDQAADRERDELPKWLTHSAYQPTPPSSDRPDEVTRAQNPARTERRKANRKQSGQKIDGHAVSLLREDAWLDQGELAERAGVSRGTISDIERGRRPFPKPDTINALANALGVAPELLLTRD
jgi:transcriptional regulator with XRE-family HTH domain